MSSKTARALAALERTEHGPLVLLFYDGYERLARPGLAGAIYSLVRRFARYAYRRLRGNRFTPASTRHYYPFRRA